MTSRVWTGEIDYHLTQAGHSGYRLRQDSNYTARVVHDQGHLQEYAALLKSHGYRPTLEQPTDIRPLRLRITRA
ncbi:hypothetical protein GCM10009837_07020 [Streptomyces durmitorensis]|uniref:Uncharacterized protein n=1 Tax=Streptomyces durmitorensis TaxID=319947 RepID=A0ABY4PN81_9ACTN|nr:hypothetical protein [Streptomyces durmitorensis]UQT54403.1 hypothetical protein M4V62_04475 [Streptomyces durmitorensis]